jgi:hemerythrin-like domain-containing protein
MMPIGPLMIEHRLIERMVGLLSREIGSMREKGEMNPFFIDSAVDFFRTYADRCHHGKEEHILFRDLATKPLPPDLHKIMDELIQEHRFGRELVGKLADAKERYAQGGKDAHNEIIVFLQELIEFYPTHIEKEDKHFFLAAMEYFNKEERDAMLQEFGEFDKGLIHEKYKQLVERFEGKNT